MQILIALIPTIIKLMGIAETAYANVPQSGAEKKTLVMTIIEAIFGGIGAVSTGGQAETWARIQEPVSSIIDSAAAIAFPNPTSLVDAQR